MNVRAETPYDACLREALALAGDWVPRWLSTLYETLQQRETSASSLFDKQGFGQARMLLETHRDLVGERFLSMLAEALRKSADSPSTGPAPLVSSRSLDSLSFDDLELMDHDQVQETVEMARVQQVVKMSTDEEFVAFNARLSRARGLDVVSRHAKNPFGPDVVVRALQRALGSLHLDEAVRARWLQVGALPLGQALEKAYVRLTEQLDRWGVQPASFQVVQHGTSRSSGAATTLRAESVPASALPGGDPLLTLDHLHSLLTGNLEGDGETRTGTPGPGSAMVCNLAAEVVTQLLRRIAEDTRLLQPVRDLVQGLKPALLQLARTEPRFFADRHNPARRLLDIITERGLAYTSVQDAGFEEYARQVRDVVQALQVPGAPLGERFPELLLRLSQGAVLQQVPARGLAMRTLVKVEQRNLLAERVAAEIESRNDFARAPGVVRRFLTGPWSQVVAQARMVAEPAGDSPPADAPALRYMEVLPDLLWSSQLAQASRNRPRLIKVIPVLLRTLREGLDSIDYPRAKSEAFFQALMGLHEAAYKTQHTGLSLEFPPSTPGPAVHDTWVQPGEARDTGFMDDLSIDTQPAFLDTQPLEGHDLHQQMADRLSPGDLPVGTWVDLREDDHDLRCQLTWASPHGTMFLFNDASGRSVSLTRNGLERLQSLGRLRVVADHGLVEDALDAVARQALRNSGNPCRAF